MKLADVSISRPVFATMMIVVILVFGLNALPSIGIELMPNVEFPVVTVLTTYPGASPSAVEEKVSRKLEETINTLPDIEKLNSYSSENVSQVVVQFKLNVSIDRVLQDVRDKVALIRDDLPKDIQEPLVQKLDMNAIPVLTYVLSGPPDMSPTSLTRFADKVVKQNIQKVSGVGAVNLIGGHPREIHLLLNPTALSAVQLTVDDVIQALADANIELPGGRLDKNTRELSLRVDNQVRTTREIGEIELARVNGAPVFVRDVAEVVDSEKEVRSYAAVHGNSSIFIQILKQSGTNLVATADQVKGVIEELKPALPAGVKISELADYAKFIREAIRDAAFDLIYGAILAVLIIGLFLRNREMTIISAVAIPVSIIGTFAVFQVLKFSFNYMTMLGLSLSVGIVIDDAIVVIENIYRHIEEGESPLAAAQRATSEIGLAVMATTFTIVAVFIPVAFMDGITGRFFYQFGVTVAVAVLVSLFVSFTLTPMLASVFVRKQASHGRFYLLMERFLAKLDAWYERAITGALNHRGKVALAAISLLGLSVFAASLVPAEFFPDSDEEQFQVKVETPPGSSLEYTRDVCARVERIVNTLPGIVLISTTIGGGGEEKVNEGALFIKLTAADQRPYSQAALISKARERLTGFPGAIINVGKAQDEMSGGGHAEPIQLAIRGNDLPLMEATALRIVNKLNETPGFVNADSSVRAGKEELRIRVNRSRASQLGVKPAQVALAVRNLIASVKVGELSQGEDRYDIRLWLPKEKRTSIAILDQIKVRSASGSLVSLADLTELSHDVGPTQIERQQRQRQVVVYSYIEGIALSEAQQKVEAIAAAMVPPGYSVSFLGDVQDMEESATSVMKALVLAIILVYIILASQFNSFIHPLTIMFSLPFSVIGAFGGLLLSGSSLSMMSMIGLIMLMGLVTKNAILLVDRVNQNLARGLERKRALIEAGGVRLRPILMTTFAMIFGMLPVALALSKGSEVRSPMAVTVIGGLITSTLLTLVVVPVVYAYLDDLVIMIKRKASGNAI